MRISCHSLIMSLATASIDPSSRLASNSSVIIWLSKSARSSRSKAGSLASAGSIAILDLWPALTIAVAEQWGGPESADKKVWIASTIIDEWEQRTSYLPAAPSSEPTPCRWTPRTPKTPLWTWTTCSATAIVRAGQRSRIATTPRAKRRMLGEGSVC
jgi:hypothetical protein